MWLFRERIQIMFLHIIKVYSFKGQARRTRAERACSPVTLRGTKPKRGSLDVLDFEGAPRWDLGKCAKYGLSFILDAGIDSESSRR